jgi:hypothetical protein
LLWVLHDLKTNVLIIKRFILPLRLFELARLSGIRDLAKRLFILVELGYIALIYILYYSSICPVAIIAAIHAAGPVYVFVNSAIVAPIVLKVEEDVVIGFNVVASVAIIITLKLVVGVNVAIIVIIIICRFLRVCALTSLFSLAKGVFASFAL